MKWITGQMLFDPIFTIHMHRKWFAWTIFHRNWILSTMLPSMPNFRICFLYSFGNFECFNFSEFHLTTDFSALNRKKYTATTKSSSCWYWIKFFMSICIWSQCCIHIYNLYYHFAHKYSYFMPEISLVDINF